MLKKIVVIITIMSVSVCLNGMEIPYQKTEEQKDKKALQKFTNSDQESNKSKKNNSNMSISSANSNKLSVKNLNDLKDMKRAQGEFRDKAFIKKGENLSGNK